jgi:hypothetical protein
MAIAPAAAVGCYFLFFRSCRCLRWTKKEAQVKTITVFTPTSLNLESSENPGSHTSSEISQPNEVTTTAAAE